MLQSAFEFVEHHEGIETRGIRIDDQRVRDFVLYISGRNAFQSFVLHLAAQLLDVLGREARQALAVVEFELLHQRQTVMLGLLQSGEDGPHGSDFQRVRGDVLAADALRVVVLLVDLDLFVQDRDIGNVDLDRAVAQGFHELVRLELAILRLVRVADDHRVDVGLRELLRLDLVLLRRTQQVVQEGDIELEDFDEFDQTAIRDVELAIEVKRSGVATRCRTRRSCDS